MALKNILSQKRAAILHKWHHLILETYPADTSQFLKQDKDRFANPVGYTLSRETEALYDGLLQGLSPDKLTASLDSIIRIRSVQDFPPSQAIAFVFLLKKTIREELAGEIEKGQVAGELLEFETRIDRLALLALDIYMKCREKVCEIRINEAKAETEMALKLLERANLLYGKAQAEQKDIE